MGNNARRLEGLCAAAIGSLEGIEEGPDKEIAGTTGSRAGEIKAMEVEAFSSVHDMIHAAINSYGQQAALKQVYQACQLKGRIAYKRAGGSRLITNNDHWKSQIRHALYTSDRFQRVAEGADMWMVSPQYCHEPQTVIVLVRSDSNADSICDDSQKCPSQPTSAKPPRRGSRSKQPTQKDSPLPVMNTRRKRTSREVMNLAAKASNPTPQLAMPSYSEHIDECSHIDHAPTSLLQRQQGGVCNTPVSTNRESSLTPSPGAWTWFGESSAWQRAARQLNSNFHGSTGISALSCEQSIEAESPVVKQPLYALRSLARPPPGFGTNPDPVAEQAAREAHARTTGPLKKRLKAAAKAAELAASFGSEEATSTHHGQSGTWTVPSPLTRGSHTQYHPTLHHPAATKPWPLLSTAPYFKQACDWDALERRPSSGTLTCVNSSAEATTHITQRLPGVAVSAKATPLTFQHANETGPWTEQCNARWNGRVKGRLATEQDCDIQEGADETDEGGGKRILRSHTAAAAADLDRENSVDRSNWSG